MIKAWKLLTQHCCVEHVPDLTLIKGLLSASFPATAPVRNLVLHFIGLPFPLLLSGGVLWPSPLFLTLTFLPEARPFVLCIVTVSMSLAHDFL